MKIIQEFIAGLDCPEELAGDPKFVTAVETVTRRRLDLRPEDIVEVRFV